MFSFKAINWAAILVTFLVIIAAAAVTAKMISYTDPVTGAEMKGKINLPGDKEEE